MADEAFEARAARRRATWAGELRTEHRAIRIDETTVAQRVGVMRELAEAGWALCGAPLPSYTRAEMPGRVIRPSGTA
jgi:hypothetical protein